MLELEYITIPYQLSIFAFGRARRRSAAREPSSSAGVPPTPDQLPLHPGDVQFSPNIWRSYVLVVEVSPRSGEIQTAQHAGAAVRRDREFDSSMEATLSTTTTRCPLTRISSDAPTDEGT